MNVIISNKYQALLANLNIDVIKSINGVFSIEDLIGQFANFYYNKMIIDITALENYENIATIQQLTVNFDQSKIILLLDDSEVVNSPVYLSQLVSIGIYNFTKSVDAISFLIDNPNSYKDVQSYHNLNNFANSKPILNDKPKPEEVGFIGQRVLGFVNVTEGAGSTTLVYLLKKHLESVYKVKAVELNANDFAFLNDKSLDSITGVQLSQYITDNSDAEVILVDINNETDVSLCNDIIYLIEPGLIKLNKLIRQNSKIFEELQNKKIVLNRSVLNEKDISDFEKESRSKVFFNIPYLDDKLDNQSIINQFLSAIGFSRIENSSSSGLFNIFK